MTRRWLSLLLFVTACKAAPEPRAVPRVAFLYTGQGAQYHGMGLELREAFPVFREAFDRCDLHK